MSRLTVLLLSALAQATEPPTTPARATAYRPYLTLRRTETLLSLAYATRRFGLFSPAPLRLFRALSASSKSTDANHAAKASPSRRPQADIGFTLSRSQTSCSWYDASRHRARPVPDPGRRPRPGPYEAIDMGSWAVRGRGAERGTAHPFRAGSGSR